MQVCEGAGLGGRVGCIHSHLELIKEGKVAWPWPWVLESL